MDAKTVEGFGQEWTSFDQSALSQDELRGIFEEYFELFRWDKLPRDAVGFELGCGSGRWARFVAPRVGKLHCIDASEAAVKVAKRTLQDAGNCEFHVASVDAIPIADGTMDFGYTLGVIHTLPDAASGIRSCAAKLKADAPFLIYTSYALENRPVWFRALWTASDLMRRGVSRLPYPPRLATATSLALGIYWPLARLALLAESLGLDVRNFPLTSYRRRGFYTMRNDALDRFGTRVEHRFTADQIREMMSDAGLDRIVFSENNFWCAIGYKKA